MSERTTPKFSDLEWKSDRRGPEYQEWAEVYFPNGWEVSFLRGPGRQKSRYINDENPYEILPWFRGAPVTNGPGGNWPKYGDAERMQRLMDLISSQKTEAEKEKMKMFDAAMNAAAKAVRDELIRLDYLDGSAEPDEEDMAIAVAAITAWLKSDLEGMPNPQEIAKTVERR